MDKVLEGRKKKRSLEIRGGEEGDCVAEYRVWKNGAEDFLFDLHLLIFFFLSKLYWGLFYWVIEKEGNCPFPLGGIRVHLF